MNLQPLGLIPFRTAVANHASAIRGLDVANVNLANATARLNAHTAASNARGTQNTQTLSNLLTLLRR